MSWESQTEADQAFMAAVKFVLPHENEYARGHWGDPKFVVAENVSGDPGGVTKYGIDQASHPGVDVANLDEDGARAIYFQEWLRHNLDALPEKLAVASFDVWVNGGHASRWLQHAWNLTHPGELQLAEDGSLGPESLADLARCDEAAILEVFIQERNDRFKALAANNPHLRQFLAGWLQRDLDLQDYLRGLPV